MKLIISNGRIAATATDAYTGPDFFIEAPADFDVARMAEYRYADGVLSLQPATQVTRLAFRNRFTAAEKVALELASLDNPAGTLEQRQQAAALRVYLTDVASSSFVDLSRPDTRAGVQQLEAWGLLATGRAPQILDAPILVTEAYKP